MATTSVPELGRRAKAASRLIATASGGVKDTALRLAPTCSNSTGPTSWRQRPRRPGGRSGRGHRPPNSTGCGSTDGRVEAMAEGLRQVAGLADPVGEVVEGSVLRTACGWSGSGTSGRHRHHLREPAQRHQRRRRLCLKAGKRHHAAGLVLGRPFQCRHRVVPRLGAGKAGLAEDVVVLSRTPA